jgi:phosphatidylserine decarboxylase
MKFGSRIDLFLPRTARLHVKLGDRVVGGESTVATLAAAEAAMPAAAAGGR